MSTMSIRGVSKNTNTRKEFRGINKIPFGGTKNNPNREIKRFKSTKIQHAVGTESQSNISIHLFNGTLEFVHVAFKKREVREKEILEAVVLLWVGGQHEDNSDGNLLLPSHTKAWSATFIRHVEALLNWPDQDRAHIELVSENTTALSSNMYIYISSIYYLSKLVRALLWSTL